MAARSSTATEIADALRISDVVRETGVAKELIHHYLRQGVLPAAASRGRYGQRHVRLLRQVRTLRDDHNLPLDVIRRLFELFDFAPARIEALTLSESLCKRATRFASTGELLSHDTMTEDELAAAAGVSVERVHEYLEARMVAPLGSNGDGRYSLYDVAVIALCEHGVELGIPFESFRTIASYVRIAFDLEHSVFYGTSEATDFAPEDVLPAVFVRREVASSFVQNLMHAMTQRRIGDLFEQAQPMRATALDALVYRPSDAFLRRHGIEERINEAQDELREAPDEPRRWAEIGELLLHAGRYDDGVFFLEESLERWPDDSALRNAFGRALLLAGDEERGRAQLVSSSCARATIMSAMSKCREAIASERPEALLREGAAILATTERALQGRSHPEVSMFCGWLLASLPPIYGTVERGLALLRDTLERARQRGPMDVALPGARDRRIVNAAYLLFDCLARGPRADAAELDELAALICRLDPSSAMAESVFLRRDAA